MADIRCPRCSSESISRDTDANAGRDIPLVCEDCGTRWRRTPRRSCPRCGSLDFQESAVDGWAFDDIDEARENRATTEWSYVDRLVFRCLRCRNEWESVEASHPYQANKPASGRDCGRTAQELMSFLDRESRRMDPALPLIASDPDLVARRITDLDAATLSDGVERGLIAWRQPGYFDTLDRPAPPKGRWWLVERDRDGRRPCWEFVPQLAAYVELIRDSGYHRHRVLFDTPKAALHLDLAVLDDASRVVVLGEAKKETKDLDRLERGLFAHVDEQPEPKRGDEPRQLAWRLWVTRAKYLWLIGPADRRAFEVAYDPLELTRLDRLPDAGDLGLAAGPEHMMEPPSLV